MTFCVVFSYHSHIPYSSNPVFILYVFFIFPSLHRSYLISECSTLVYQVFNFSTGRIINKTVLDSEVTSMDHDHTGQLIFCGDAQVWPSIYLWSLYDLVNLHVLPLKFLLEWYVQGCIYSIRMNSHTGALSRSHRHRSTSKHKSPVTTVQYRSFSLLARGPVLLTCTQDGNLSFFRSGELKYALRLSSCYVWLTGVAMKEWERGCHPYPYTHLGKWYGDLSPVHWGMILPDLGKGADMVFWFLSMGEEI